MWHGVNTVLEQHLLKYADKTAAIYNDEIISYYDLNVRSKNIAYHLLAGAPSAGDIVGIHLERSLSYLISLVAVIRSGLVFFPIDKKNPQKRIAAMIKKSACNIIIGDDARHSTASKAAVVCYSYDDIVCRPDNAADNLQAVNTVATDTAYVMFTSGSTGEPKGVMVNHQGMLNHLNEKIALLTIGRDDLVVNNAPIGFDICVWQMLAPLLAGASVLIVDEITATNPVALIDTVRQRGATLLETVPSLLNVALYDSRSLSGQQTAPLALKYLLVTGEAVSVQLCDEWIKRYPDIALVNAYGPTECSDDITHYIVDIDHCKQCNTVPIGYAIEGAGLIVLKNNGNQWDECEEGEVGELWVYGPCLANGYINDPLKTSRAFVRTTLSNGKTALCYRTGDLVHKSRSGLFYYHGRCDRQVKISGRRVELGEIEAVIRQSQYVKDVAVVLHAQAVQTAQHKPQNQVLLAYVIWIDSKQEKALQQFMLTKLPDAMLPDRFITLLQLPLTSNGKVDYNNLPAPPSLKPKKKNNHSLPADATERQIVRIWEEVLSISPIAMDEQFRDLSNNSLAAIRIATRVSKEMLRGVNFGELFKRSTPREFADYLKSQGIARE